MIFLKELFLVINNAQDENPIRDCALLSLWINIDGFGKVVVFPLFSVLIYYSNFPYWKRRGKEKKQFIQYRHLTGEWFPV